MGNFANEGHTQVFQILAAAHFGIHVLLHEDKHCRNQQADGECHQQDIHLAGSGGKHTAARGGDQAGIVGGECLRELVFLTFLEQVEIKLFFHLLLAFHRQQVFRLVRVGCQPVGGGFLLAEDATDLGVQGDDQIVHRLDDGALHTLQGTRHILYQWVLLATVGYQPVAVEHQIVVFTDEGFYIGIDDAGIGR